MASGKLTVTIPVTTDSPREVRARGGAVQIRPRAGWTDPWSELAEELIASGQEHQAEEVVRHASRLAPEDARVRHLRTRLAGA